MGASTRRGFRSSFSTLFFLVIANFATPPPVMAVEQVLDPGGVHVVPAAAASCFTAINIPNSVPSGGIRLTTAKASCDGGRLRVELDSGESTLPKPVDATATARFVTEFRVPAVAGATAPSFVPVTVTVPVSWAGLLFNDNLVPGSFFAWANDNMYVRLREGDAAHPDTQGAILHDFRFSGASHGGISKCLTVPTSLVSVATTSVKCAIAALSQESGSQTVTLNGVIETGKTYDIEVDIDGEIHTDDAEINLPGLPPAGAHPLVDFMVKQVGFDEPGVVPGDITFNIGTDFQRNLADLQNEIDKLRSDFENHTHQYLTGRGVGQNNTVVDTGPPIVVDAPTPPAPPPDAAKPVITGATIAKTKGQGSTVVLEVSGSGFVTGAVVRWNGADRPTAFVGPTALRASLSPSDIKRPAMVSVTVADPPPDGAVSDPYLLTVK
ncbi:MAG TPA: hypothetical protein VFV19_13755 [Candidatus Polarisedimenticolaceae bacterium]|nr:hypothetical protein [Candidatus Polarisedimenticolaceae bacterium]